MIKLIEKVIRNELAGTIKEPDTTLSYLKLCTPTSGKTLNDKVIFLVFKNSSPHPFLCVKTVRTYTAKEVILRNFRNLGALNKLVDNSSFAPMFAEALHLYDDGEFVFSIERACVGTKISSNEENLKRVVDGYTALQKYFAGQNRELVGELGTYAERIFSDANLPATEQRILLDYAERLPLNGIRLPRIVQHGDLTFDNMLWSADGLCLIDYDFVGVTDLPGFDLFGLYRRFYGVGSSRMYKKLLSEYFGEIGVRVKEDDYPGLFFLYQLIEYLKRKPDLSGTVSAEKILSDFESFYAPR